MLAVSRIVARQASFCSCASALRLVAKKSRLPSGVGAGLYSSYSLLTDGPEARPDNPGVSLAKLVIEVSDTSLRGDTHEKLQLYQAAGVPEYWAVDVRGRRVLRYLAPDYAPEAFTEGTLSPQAYPDVSIDVGALFL